MKKTLSVAACAVMLIALTSCGSAPAEVASTPAPVVTVTETATPAPETPTPEATTETPTPEATTEASIAVPTHFAKLTPRSWALIVKNPDAYIGKAYVVYGVVVQFDSATGTDTFRAMVSDRNRTYWYTDGKNTVLTGDADALSSIVEDDEFRANVVVTGSLSYDTQSGGNTTVPQLQVISIKVTGTDNT